MTYRLFINPFLFTISTLYKALMEDLEVYGRSAERGKAQIPCTNGAIGESS